ncbi:MAG: zinc dependent phospholipase C family protein [Deltaproteobacteria bacterium]
MLYKTHLFFSKITYDNMLCENRVKINKLGFKYGNIKPDIIMNFKDIPHNYFSSAEYINSEINALIEKTICMKDLHSNDFAVNLGVINHYIADFFCMPHNKNLVNKSIVSHFIYERKLDTICKKIKIYKLKKYLNSNTLTLNPKDNISEVLHLIYHSYKQKKFSATNDIFYAIYTCIIVNNYIVKACLSKIKFKAA